MTKHTPGPWWLQADGAGWYVECTPERGHSVAYIRSEVAEDDPDTPDAEKKANARLIAAAPELLEALQKFVAWSEAERNHEGTTFWERVEMLRDLDDAAAAAIAKATGETK